MVDLNRIAIITIHSGDIKNLDKTLSSIDIQVVRPDLNLVIVKEKKFNPTKFKKNYRKFIIGKDKSLWNAMNIGLKKTFKYNIFFLNSGDELFSKNSIKNLKNEILKNKNINLIFKTILKYKNMKFYPKEIFFLNKNYSPHPSFVRHPIKRHEIKFFDEKNKINADGFWMKKIRKDRKFKKINKILSIYNLGGQSSNPSIESILSLFFYNFNDGIKEVLKFILSKIFHKKQYYKIIYKPKFEIKVEKKK